jgi:hypothetical protein
LNIEIPGDGDEEGYDMMMEANLASGTEQVEEGHDSMGMEEEEDSYENIDGVRLRRI